MNTPHIHTSWAVHIVEVGNDIGDAASEIFGADVTFEIGGHSYLFAPDMALRLATALTEHATKILETVAVCG